jgi:hypothetical protein
MVHENEIAIKILTAEFGDYPRNAWHYDREYRMICEALRLSKLRQDAVSGAVCECCVIAGFAHLKRPERCSSCGLELKKQTDR